MTGTFGTNFPSLLFVLVYKQRYRCKRMKILIKPIKRIKICKLILYLRVCHGSLKLWVLHLVHDERELTPDLVS